MPQYNLHLVAPVKTLLLWVLLLPLVLTSPRAVNGFEFPSGKPLLGMSRADVLSSFAGDWGRSTLYSKTVDPNALRFDNSELIVVLDFNSRGIVEGVSFLSHGYLNSQDAFVARHYDELVRWATGAKQIKSARASAVHPIVDIVFGRVHNTKNAHEKRNPPAPPRSESSTGLSTGTPRRSESMTADEQRGLIKSDAFWKEVERELRKKGYR